MFVKGYLAKTQTSDCGTCITKRLAKQPTKQNSLSEKARHHCGLLQRRMHRESEAVGILLTYL